MPFLNTPIAHTLLLALHLLGAVVWVGGMFFAHFCLRPAAMAVLQPPQRLPLWSATLARFLGWLAGAVLVVLATGFAMLAPVGMAHAPVGWHIMMTLGVVMAVIYGVVWRVLHPRLAARVQAADWPAAAQVQNRIRQLVSFNLALGVVVIVAAASAR